MKNRLIALCILLVIFGVPAGIYWYLKSGTAQLTVTYTPNIPLEISLQGKLNQKNAPILERGAKMYIQKQICQESPCIFQDILPLEYKILGTASGYEAINQEIEIKFRENKILNLALKKSQVPKKNLILSQKNKNEEKFFESQIKENLIGTSFIRYYGNRGGYGIFLSENSEGKKSIQLYSQDKKEFTLLSYLNEEEGNSLIYDRGNQSLLWSDSTASWGIVWKGNGYHKIKLPTSGIQSIHFLRDSFYVFQKENRCYSWNEETNTFYEEVFFRDYILIGNKKIGWTNFENEIERIANPNISFQKALISQDLQTQKRTFLTTQEVSFSILGMYGTDELLYLVGESDIYTFQIQN